MSIAYQVVGDGPFDLLLAPGFVSHLDLQWTDPGYSRFLSRLASFSRLIMYDKTGTGLSDPIPHIPSLEERTADMVAVLDAAESSEASVMAFSEGGPASVLLATSHPERVRSLVLYGTFAAHLLRIDPNELTPEQQAWADGALAQLEEIMDHWGEGRGMAMFAPTLTSDVQRRFYATFERAAASPRMARALIASLENIDVRPWLPTITCPTMVVHRTGDRVLPVWAGQALAEAIPGARWVELEGVDHAFWFGEFDPILDEMERFLTGTVRQAEPDRILATVLFTDIVGSTELAAQLGDAKWRDILERHDALIKEVVAAHGGRVVKHIGDGALSAFTGPAKAVRAAEELCARATELGVELRAGVHTGECEAIGDDLGGLAVHIGARVGAKAGAGEVLVSGTVKDLVVGSGLVFSDHGEHELKGVPGQWRLFALGEERRETPREDPLDAAVDHMRASDKVVVSLARRAPRMLRFGARVATRNT